VRSPDGHGIDDDVQRRGAGCVAVTLTIEKFGLDSEFGSFGEKIHWARGLARNDWRRCEYVGLGKRIVVSNSVL
jgi:hypothetical protein